MVIISCQKSGSFSQKLAVIDIKIFTTSLLTEFSGGNFIICQLFGWEGQLFFSLF
jgi:hypothetical protein